MKILCLPILNIGISGGVASGIPSENNALFWLDGTLSGENFIDKIGGKLFPIANRDFTASYFPYKSAATISAPAGDATLIAADINNFWYDSGGTPNEIPVVSFFNNIDYEDKLFCRHIDQLVDANGVETAEPYVVDIVLYSSVLTGNDLLIANAYYEVAAEAVGAYWVSPGGNDTTGDGSKGNPWLTLDKALDTIDDGSLIYSKSNEYPGDSGLNYIYDPRTNQVKGIGHCRGNTTSASYTARFKTGTIDLFEGIIFELMSAATYAINCEDQTTLIFKRNIINKESGSLSLAFRGIVHTIQNCIIIGVYTNGITVLNTTTVFNLLCNYFKPTATADLIRLGNNTALTTINNNKIEGVISDKIIEIGNINGNTNIIGNIFNPTTNPDAFISCLVDSLLVRVIGNTFTGKATSTIIVHFDGAVTYAHEIYNNVFNSEGFTGDFIYALNSSLDIQNNIITELTGNGAGSTIKCEINATGAYSASIINNRIISKGTAPVLAGVGYGTPSDGDNSATVEISNNYLKGISAFDTEANNAGHGILSHHQQDVVIKYNYTFGAGYGLVYKGLSDTILTGLGAMYNVFKDYYVSLLVKGAQGFKFYNNTVICKNILPSKVFDIRDNEGVSIPDNCDVRNNIFIMLKSGLNLIQVQESLSNTFDYNLYYCPNGTLTFNADSTGYTFAEWQAEGFDTHSIVLTEAQFNALFTDFDNNDFSLPIGSAAIGAGETLISAYDDGLDKSTAWGDDETLPVIVTKQQTAPWDCGAYVS